MNETPPEFTLVETFSAFFEAIGRLVIAHSRLEYAIDFSIKSLINITENQFLLLEGKMKNISTRIDLLEEIVQLELSDSTLVAEFDDMIKVARALNSFRNQIMHGQWIGASSVGTSGDATSIVHDSAFKTPLSKNKKRKHPIHL